MGIYDNREWSAYGQSWGRSWRFEDGDNPHILKWWTSSHDELIPRLIEIYQWHWAWRLIEEIEAITPAKKLESWQSEDPLCQQWAWYNVLMNFAGARAARLGLTDALMPGLTDAIRDPQWKTCPLCELRFREDSLPVPFIEKLGVDNLDFCAPCLKEALFPEYGDPVMEREEVLAFLRELAALLGCVPDKRMGGGDVCIAEFEPTVREAVLRLLKRKPSARRVEELFNSWLNALVEAGVLEDGPGRMAFGT